MAGTNLPETFVSDYYSAEIEALASFYREALANYYATAEREPYSFTAVEHAEHAVRVAARRIADFVAHHAHATEGRRLDAILTVR